MKKILIVALFVLLSLSLFGETIDFFAPDNIPDGLVCVGYRDKTTYEVVSFPYEGNKEDLRPIYKRIKDVFYSYVEEEGKIKVPVVNNIKDESIKYLALPNNVSGIITSLGDYQNNKIEVLIINEGVVEIGVRALTGMTSLKSVTLPGSLKSIEKEAFKDNKSLEKIILNEGIKSIGSEAFAYCSNVKLITIPESVESIGEGAFRNCSSLETIVIPDGIKRIEDYTFSECTSLRSITFPSTLESVGEYSFSFCNALKALDLPEGLKEIDNSAFCGCESLYTVKIPSTIEHIGQCAFYYCPIIDFDFVSTTNLKWVGPSAFAPWSYDVEISLPQDVKDSFAWCLELPNDICAVIIPEEVTEIPRRAFDGFKRLREIKFPESSAVTKIGEEAFSNTRISKIEIPASVKKIGKKAFASSYYLSDVEFGENTCLEELDVTAFDDCHYLEEIHIPKSVNKLSGLDSFDIELFHIKKVYIDNNIGALLPGFTFEDLENDYVNFIFNDSPKILVGYSGSTPSVQLVDSVLKIEDKAVIGLKQNYITYLEIPEGVESIENDVFENNGYIKEVVLPSTLKYIGDSAFNGAYNLSSINFPNSLKSIGSYAFYGCTSLKSVELPTSLTFLGAVSFYDCSSLESIVISEGVERIEDWTFRGCTSLSSVTLPKSLKSIGVKSFLMCDSLESIAIPNEVKSIGDYAFWDCSSLTSITIPESVESIGDNAFYECPKLTSIYVDKDKDTISGAPWSSSADILWKGTELINVGYLSMKPYLRPIEKILEIKDNVITKCKDSSIYYLEIPEGVTGIADGAFQSCSYLSRVSIPESLSFVGASAFENSSFRDVSITSLDNIKWIGPGALASISLDKDSETYKMLSSVFPWALEMPYNITSITIPEGITEIPDNAFASLVNLSEVKFSENSNVKQIGDYAFSGCPSLLSFSIPESVSTIGEGVLSKCDNLTSIYVDKDTDTISGSPWGSKADVIWKDTKSILVGYGKEEPSLIAIVKVLEVKDDVVTKCKDNNISYLEIPEGIIKIADDVFVKCTKLRTVSLPSTIKAIGKGTFNISSLREVKFSSVDDLEWVGVSAFYFSQGLELPSKVRDSFPWAFKIANDITTVEIPNFVKALPSWAFSGLKNLKEVKFAEDSELISIGYNAFNGCSSLLSLDIPNGVVTIDDYAFNGCANLTSITIPESVESIGLGAFFNTRKLKNIVIDKESGTIPGAPWKAGTTVKWREN